MKRLPKNSPILIVAMFGLPVLVLWLSINLVNQRVNIMSWANQGTVSEQDKGVVVWLANSSVKILDGMVKMVFRMNSMETDVDSVMLHLVLPSDQIEVKNLVPGIFGVKPEYIKQGANLYIVINNIGFQGSGDLFTMELSGIGLAADQKVRFVQDECYARGPGGKIGLSLPEV